MPGKANTGEAGNKLQLPLSKEAKCVSTEAKPNISTEAVWELPPQSAHWSSPKIREFFRPVFYCI